MHTKGYSASETKLSLDKARTLIEHAEARGEPLEDPLMLFSVLFGAWINSAVAFDSRATSQQANHLLTLAQALHKPAPLVIAHRAVGQTLAFTGDFVAARVHLNKGVDLYDRTEHRQLATRFGQDPIETILSARAWVLVILGFAEAAVEDARQALNVARQIDHAATLMHALSFSAFTYLCCRDYEPASTIIAELAALADKKDASLWKAAAVLHQGYLLAMIGRAGNAVQITTSGIKALRSTGASLWVPTFLSSLAAAFAELGKFEDARRCITEATDAVKRTGEKWWEAEVHRTAGEIALKSSALDDGRAEAHFVRALQVAQEQQAKSWELRAAMSLARLWRDQGKVQQARELLAPVYGWFTEGFATRDLKEAKALLEELGS
jgi:predicted ATPase